MCVSECVSLFCSAHVQGFSEEIQECLPSWHLDIDKLRITPDVPLSQDPTNHPTALSNALRQLTTLHAPHTAIVLQNWHWDTHTAQALAAHLPHLPHLKITVCVDEQLTDELLGVVLAMGPHVHKLSVKGLNLKSDSNSKAVWPWAVFECKDVDLCAEVGMLVRLPHPRSYTGVGAQGHTHTGGVRQGQTAGVPQGHTQPTQGHTGPTQPVVVCGDRLGFDMNQVCVCVCVPPGPRVRICVEAYRSAHLCLVHVSLCAARLS